MEKYKDFLIGKGAQIMFVQNRRIFFEDAIRTYSTKKTNATYVQMLYLSNGSLIKQLNTEIQRDEEILRSVTTTILEQSIPDVFDNGTS